MVSRGFRTALVLGGGGIRGLAHVGALQELTARGLEPAEVIGSSIGALVAAAWAFGYSLAELEAIALSMRRRDIFTIAHGDMALKRLRAPALYHAEPLDHLVTGLFGDATFADLPKRLIIGSVEINSGMQMYWGLPGLTHVRVADAVYASCALPGFFPPREIDGRYYVDGALVDNLPVRLAASRGHDAVVAVDVGASSVLRADQQEEGFAALFARATEIVFEHTKELHLAAWHQPPLLLVQPRVEHVPMFSFAHTRELLGEGRRATAAALDASADAIRTAQGGIFPRRTVQLAVLRERCIGCGTCVAIAPAGTFRMDGEGKAVARADPLVWSPMDGGFVRHCPTWAITVRSVPDPSTSTGDASRGTAPAPA
jgi:NTE family protein